MSSLVEMLRNWKTTLLGVLPAGLALAIALGWIDLEQQQAILNGVEVVFDTSESLVNEVAGAISTIAAIIAVFSKDGDK